MEREQRNVKKKLRIGIVGSLLILIGVFAIFTIVLYTLEDVLGIIIPYPQITITITWALIGLLGVWILGHTVETTASQLTGSQSASTIRKIVTVTLAFAVLVATVSKLGFDLSGYLVSLGVTAVVIGLAAQTTIGNLIAGLLVLVSKPFRKGDYIRVNITGAPIEGTIDQISFLRSRIFTNDGVSISVPNTVMLAVPISNFTVFEKRPIILSATLDRNFVIDDLKSKIEAGITSENGTEVRLYVKGFDSDTTTVELWVQVTTQNFLRERSQLVHQIKGICEREGIPMRKIELREMA